MKQSELYYSLLKVVFCQHSAVSSESKDYEGYEGRCQTIQCDFDKKKWVVPLKCSFICLLGFLWEETRWCGLLAFIWYNHWFRSLRWQRCSGGSSCQWRGEWGSPWGEGKVKRFIRLVSTDCHHYHSTLSSHNEEELLWRWSAGHWTWQWSTLMIAGTSSLATPWCTNQHIWPTKLINSQRSGLFFQ